MRRVYIIMLSAVLTLALPGLPGLNVGSAQLADADELETASPEMTLATASSGPDPSQISIQSVTYGGTGCPAGSVGHSLSDDRTQLALVFDKFVAKSGPGIPVTEARKNCQLNINVRIPQGFSYSVGTFDYRGYVQLPSGVSAESKSTYYFQGEVTQASSSSRFAGPVAKDYLARDTLGIVAWMPCDGRVVPVNVNAQVRLTGPSTASAQITTDSIDGKVKHILGIQYRRC
jgi:hypothetical protein